MFIKAFLEVPVDFVDIQQILLSVVERISHGSQQPQGHGKSCFPVQFSMERCPYSVAYEVEDRQKSSDVRVFFLSSNVCHALSLKVIELPLVDLHGVLLNKDDLHFV